jgi:hypothetical protein
VRSRSNMIPRLKEFRRPVRIIFGDADPYLNKGVSLDQLRPFPIGRDRRRWASVRSQAPTPGQVQVHDPAGCGYVIRARMLAQ